MTAQNRESDHVIPDGCRDGCEHETLRADGPPVEDRQEQSGDGFEVRMQERVQDWMARSMRSPEMRRNLRRVRRGYRYVPPAPVKATRKKRGWR